MKATMKYTIPKIVLSYVCDGLNERLRMLDPTRVVKHMRSTWDKGQIGFRESFKVLYINRNNRILGVQTVSEGGCSCTLVDKKLILSGALLSNASAIILCHNHPSGNVQPSREDDMTTKQIKDGCKLFDIILLDHIIISESGHYSYADEGRL